MTRLFVAVDLPEAVRERTAELCHGVRGARWTDPDQFHLTLAFLGEVDGPGFVAARDGLAAVRAEPFELALAGVGHFPPRGRPRVLWAGLDPSEPLLALHRRVVSRLERQGLAPERRRYAPHVTLARLQRPALPDVLAFLAAHGTWRLPPFPVDAFQLYSSVLGRRGATHRVEASYPLEGAWPG